MAQLVTINFHNALDIDDFIDIVVDPDDFSEGVIRMLVPRLTFRNTESALRGVTVVPLRESEFVGDALGMLNPETSPPISHAIFGNNWTEPNSMSSIPTKISELRGIQNIQPRVSCGRYFLSAAHTMCLTGGTSDLP